jgi:hypothetical protein
VVISKSGVSQFGQHPRFQQGRIKWCSPALDNCLDAVGFQSLIKVVAQEFVRSAWFLIDNLALTRRDALISDFAATRRVYATSILAARARPCKVLSVGTAATQRGRWPQFSSIKSNRNLAAPKGF